MKDVVITGRIAHPDKYIDDAIELAFKRIGHILLNDAKTKHSYQNQAGTLTASTFVDIMKKELTLTADTDYASYVRDHYQEDWLRNAIKDNWDFIVGEIQRALVEVMNKGN